MASKKIKIQVMEKILSANDQVAGDIRRMLAKRGIFLINLMGSPGSGKTTVLEKTIPKLGKKMAVIEGDIWSTLDTERLSKLGIKTFQINTGPFGGECHLEASWIKSAIEQMKISKEKFLFVENVGNLVCPAEFDIGAHLNVLVLSITEGEDKPLKYPLAFRVCQICLLTKIDLIPHLPLSLELLKKNLKKVNPEIKTFEMSSLTGMGMEQWFAYLKQLSI